MALISADLYPISYSCTPKSGPWKTQVFQVNDLLKNWEINYLFFFKIRVKFNWNLFWLHCLLILKIINSIGLSISLTDRRPTITREIYDHIVNYSYMYYSRLLRLNFSWISSVWKQLISCENNRIREFWKYAKIPISFGDSILVIGRPKTANSYVTWQTSTVSYWQITDGRWSRHLRCLRSWNIARSSVSTMLKNK